MVVVQAGFVPYVPFDRRTAIAQRDALSLPEYAPGAVLMADLAGFSQLTTRYACEHGLRRGAEEITAVMDRLFAALIDAVHAYRGSVIGFAGDAITCWFADPTGRRALAAAQRMQQVMPAVASVSMTDDESTLTLKVAVVTGPVRRWLVGDPSVQQLDVLAGRTLDRLAAAGALARSGEIVCDLNAGADLPIMAWRIDPVTGERFAALNDHTSLVLPPDPWPLLDLDTVSLEQFQHWLLPAVAAHLQHGSDAFLGSFRSAVALFLCFDGIAYDQDPDAGQQLDAFIRWTQQILDSYAGALIQLTTGDKGSYLYAAFGAPISTSDMVEHALAAAWALRDAPAQFPFLHSVQIGISQGTCYTGAYGSPSRRTYGVLGDEVNRAARLMQHAAPGQILVSITMTQAAAAPDRCWYTFRPLAPIHIKGTANAVSVAELGARGGIPVALGNLDASCHLIGRQHEHNQLAALLADAAQGRGRLLLIEGEAGIGKSRLVAELQRLAEQHGARCLIGSGQSIQRHRSYWVWQAMLTAFCQLGSIRSRVARQAQVQQMVTELIPDARERLPLLNDVLDDLHLSDTPLTAALEGENRQRALIDLLGTLVLRLADQQPLLVVLEDAHWMDSLSWEVVQQLGRRLSASALLFVVTTRSLPPDSPATNVFTTLVQQSGTHLRLAALQDVDTYALAAQQLGVPFEELPTTLAHWLYDRTGGQPMLVIETLRTLLADGLIAPDDAAHVQVTGDLSAAALPTTVQELVQARLDRLPPDSQLVARIAAVIGSTVPLEALRDVLAPHRELPTTVLHTALTALDAAGVLIRDQRSPGTYQFTHSIVQETVYATLLWRQRRELHGDVAAWLLRTTGEHDPPYALLVHHYHYAENYAQECDYARLAGQAAAARFANAEAMTYFDRALELLPDGAYTAQIDLLLARERLHDLAGERERQRHDLIALGRLTGLLRNRARRAEVALREAHYYTVTSAFQEAIQAAQQALTLVSPDSSLMARGFAAWGEALLFQGRYHEAQEHLKQARALAQTAGASDIEAHALLLLLRIATLRGHYADARACYTAAVALLTEQDDRSRLAYAAKDVGSVCLDTHDYAGAEEYYQQALAMMREIGDRRGEGMVMSNLGVLRWRQGDLSIAADYYQYDLEICRATGDQDGALSAYLNLGNLATEAGSYRVAHEYLHAALDLSCSLRDEMDRVYAQDTLGVLAHYQGDLATAAQYYAEAQAGALAQDDVIGGLRMDALQGLLAHHQGDDAAAVTLCRRALEQAQTVEAVAEEAAALLYLGHALTSLHDLVAAADAYRAAASILQEGSPHRLAEARAGTALVLLRQGQKDAALVVVEELLPHLEEHPWLPGTDEPLRVWWVCWEVLQHHADPRASAILEHAYRLLHERAEQVLAGRRTSFLALPVHRAIQTSWNAIKGNNDAGSAFREATYHL